MKNNVNGDAFILTARNVPGNSTRKKGEIRCKVCSFVMSNLIRNCFRRVQNKVGTKNNSLATACCKFAD